MQNFTHHIRTKVHFGKGQIEKLGEVAESGKKVLLVYGGGSIKKSGIYDDALRILKDAGVEVFELSGVEPNPRIESVRRGVEICKANNINSVLAIGGGSTIDCAKIVAAGACYDGDAWDLLMDGSKITAALPVYCVLTLAATGSEMDMMAVISDMSINEKVAVGSPLVVPTMSIMDPAYTFSVSKKQTAAGTFDIMSHTLENYFTGEEGFFQARMCEAVLKTLIKYGPIAVREPENYEARANLMWAGSWAINGTLSDGVAVPWCVHPIEHELSAFYDVTHGEGLAILTPHWMEFALNEDTVDKFYDYGVNVWEIEKSDDKMAVAKEAIAKTADFIKNGLMVPTTLREVGITDKDKLDLMASKAAKNVAGVYVPMTETDIRALFEACF